MSNTKSTSDLISERLNLLVTSPQINVALEIGAINNHPSSLDSIRESFDKHLREMGESWRDFPARPKPNGDSVLYWRSLLDAWIADESLPLLIRKGGLRGLPHRHASGRAIIVADNSAAQWAYAGAVLSERPTLADVDAALRSGDLPVAMMFKREETLQRKEFRSLHPDVGFGGAISYTKGFGCLNRWRDGNAYKLAHIHDVGLGDSTHVVSIEIQILKAQMYRFLDPGNMFAAPLHYAGIAETLAFKTVFAHELPCA